MQVNFLGASDKTPLSKTFEEIAPGTFKETSYPFVKHFNSIERTITCIEDFYVEIFACSNEGFCLVKGRLDRALSDESRAGHTDANELTQWICLDVDYTVVDRTPEEFLEMLDLSGIGYIFHRSASMGIKSNTGWRGHFFILLESGQSPLALKHWLIAINLKVLPLRSQIKLSASGGALIYPLDVSTCQNDKLLYISPPTCIGFEDPIENRFTFVDGPPLRINLSGHAKNNQKEIGKVVAEKRIDLGLEKKSFSIKHHGNLEILTNPDPVTVTGRKEARGYIYLNLNGGDSWAYYFRIDNPEFLFNFKGEPCMYLKDVSQEIYDEFKNIREPVHNNGNSIPFAFLWPNDDCYYRGFADPDTGKLDWLHACGSKGKLRDFFADNGVQLPTGWAVEEWQLDFDPTEEGKADFKAKRINTYQQSKYILQAPTKITKIPPTIDAVLDSVCVDEETKDYFLNWFASIFQTREKTNTAWIFQGVQGTGKGVLFTHIIAPLIGRSYCHEMTMDRLDDDFNAYLSENIILFIDEANIADSKNGDRLLNRIKNLVTESEQHIRGMRRNAVIRKNYSNIILASNYDEIIPMEVSDRRFNVAPRQEFALQLEYDDILRIQSELAEFGGYLRNRNVDFKAVKRVLLSEAREQLIHLGETTIDTFFKAINDGNLVYFTQYLDNSIKPDLEGIRYHDYATVVHRWLRSTNDSTNVSRNELRTCYQFLQNASISATKFTKMCARHGLKMVPVRIEGQVTRGVRGIRWDISEEELANHQEQEGSNVINIKEHA